MSGEEKKNRKKAFIKWLISSLCLTGGASTGILATSENEEKIEESEEEENKKTIGGSVVKQTTKKPVDSKVELNTALSQTQRNLGTIVTNGQTLTVDMIKDKLPANIQNEVDINIQGNKATVSAKANSNYKDSVQVTFTVDKSVELSTAFTDLNLGTIETNGQDLNKQMIKDKLPANIQNEVDINIQGNKATVSAKANSNYKGSVQVTFTVDSKVELSTAFTDLNLGTIETNGQDLNKQMIKDKLPANIQNEVDINIQGNKATVSAKANSNYKGSVQVTFTVDSKVELSTAFTDLNLGTIETNGQDLNKQMIKDKLPANIQNEVDINIQGNKATVSAKAGATAKYKGNAVTVTFTVDSKVELNTALSQTQRNLGTIVTNGQTLTVDMIKDKLAANIQNEVDINIQGNKATVSAKANSNYKGSVQVTFTVDSKVELNTIFQIISKKTQWYYYEWITKSTSHFVIKEFLKNELNNYIDTSQVDIIIQNNKIIISAKFNSKKYQGQFEFEYDFDLGYLKRDRIIYNGNIW